MNVKEIVRGELIGLEAEVVKAKNKKLIGIKGRIVDETMNMIKIMDRMIIKEQVVLRIKKDNMVVDVDGRILVGRPEDRIKRMRKI